MKTNLLSQVGRAALIAFIGALGLFSAELAGLLPDLSGLSSLVVTGLIGLVSFAVERLRDVVNRMKGPIFFTPSEVNVWSRVGRALITALVGGLVLLVSQMGDLLPELSGFLQLAIGAGAGLLSLLAEYLRDYFELPEPARN